jgi:hypothetical protein
MLDFLSLGPGCTLMPPLWTTSNIQISTGVFTVDVPASISLIIFWGSQTPNKPFRPVQIDEAQAVVCALNTLPYFNSSLILPSLRPNGLNIAPKQDIDVGETSKALGDPQTSPGRPNIVLGPWKPTVNDIAFLEKMGDEFKEIDFSRQFRVCVYANCAGHAPDF